MSWVSALFLGFAAVFAWLILSGRFKFPLTTEIGMLILVLSLLWGSDAYTDEGVIPKRVILAVAVGALLLLYGLARKQSRMRKHKSEPKVIDMTALHNIRGGHK